MNTVLFNAPLYFQAVKLATPTESGLNLLGGTLAATVSSVSTGFIITWSRRLKPTTVIGDIFLILGGLAASALGVSTPGIIAVIGVSLTSLGMGFANPTVTVAVLATSETDEQAVATTTLGLFRNLGSVMGVAISSWIFQNSLIYHLEDKVTGADKDAIVQLVRKSVQAIVDLDPLHQSQGTTSFRHTPIVSIH
jgi:MFS family permease